MAYSKIKSVSVKNFRNIGSADISFEKSPIIALYGDNETGKTSLLKALCVGAVNSNPKKQKSYIRKGTNGFGIKIVLEDDTTITRIKTEEANQLEVNRPGQARWAADKIDSGTPAILTEIMGFIIEPETNEMLQIRTYMDQLLFVSTPASTNYKMMYEALKVEQLSKAIKVGTEESNELKKRLSDWSIAREEILVNIRSIRSYDLSAVLPLKERLKAQKKNEVELSKAIAVKASLDRARESNGLYSEIGELSEIQLDRAILLSEFNRLKKEKDNLGSKLSLYNNVDATEYIDVTHVVKANELMNLKMSVEASRGSLTGLTELGNQHEVDLTQATIMNSLMGKISELSSLRERDIFSELDHEEVISDNIMNRVIQLESISNYAKIIEAKQEELTAIMKEEKALSEQLKSSGAAIVNCTKCGESIVVDLESLK